MKSVTKKYLKDSQMVSCEFIDLGIIRGNHYFISFSKVEEDLVYYNFGYETVNTEDVIFYSKDRGLQHISDFSFFVEYKKREIRDKSYPAFFNGRQP